MTRRYIPLKSLRAFEAAARHLSFTHAAIELNVTHSAVSQQVKLLEDQLNCPLFLRVPRGLILTKEGEHLLPVLNESFDRIAQLLEYFAGRKAQEQLKIGVVGTFATGFLLPRLSTFSQKHPHIELQISTNNNRVDLAAEGLDYAIRFGNGAWHGTSALYLCDSPLTVLCTPAIAQQLTEPADVLNFTLLRSYRRDEWTVWLQQAAGLQLPPTHPMMVFDSSITMLEAAQSGVGVAIAPARMFSRLISGGLIEQPFGTDINLGSYWLTHLQSRLETSAMREFAKWLSAELADTSHTNEPAVISTTKAMRAAAPDQANGYEEHAAQFMSWREQSTIGVSTVLQWAQGLPRGCALLDLGCGSGLPLGKALHDQGFALFGVDASPTLLQAYQQRLPDATLALATVESADFFQRQFAAVLSIGLVFLLPEAAQILLFQKVAAALSAGGQWLFSAPEQPCQWLDRLTGRESRSLGAVRYRQLIAQVGLTLQACYQDEGGNHYFVASRPLSVGDGFAEALADKRGDFNLNVPRRIG